MADQLLCPIPARHIVIADDYYLSPARKLYRHFYFAVAIWSANRFEPQVQPRRRIRRPFTD
jgi:hypothetical protein